jgi:hypothetical protein
MWVCFSRGFISIVKKGTRGEWQVRARSREDLENLCAMIKMLASRIKVSRSGDYAYRLIVNKQELHRIFEALESSINYSNYKAEVGRHPDQVKKLSAYHEFWRLLSKLQPWPPYSGSRIEFEQQAEFDSELEAR